MATHSGRFENLHNLYRYTLICSQPSTDVPPLRLTRAELISSVHKLIRRARVAELRFLICAFFDAVQSVYASELSSAKSLTALKGSISNFVNRIAVSLIEEGVMIHSPDDVQKHMCNALIRAARCHSNTSYDSIADELGSAIMSTRGVHRGRLGSVVMSYAVHNRPPPDDSNQRALITALHPDEVQRRVAPNVFATHVKKTMPWLYPLTQLSPYKECAEFRRQCVMNAPIAPFVLDSHKSIVDCADLSSSDIQVPTRDLLREIGALDDVHTKGKQNSAAWDEFLERGMKVRYATPMCLFGKSYAELETLYADGKRIDLERGLWGAKSAPSAKKHKVNNTEMTQGVRFDCEDAILELTNESKLLGFKNGTVVGLLRNAVGSFAANDLVFFKMGECYEDCKFAAQCAEWQEAMGLPFVTTQLVWVKPTLEWWTRLPSDPMNRGNWNAALEKNLGSRIRREMDSFGYMPCLIAAYYDGTRVSERMNGMSSADDARFGLSLVKNLIFAKYVGIKDVGPFNMLVSEDQQVLIVDVGVPSTSQLNSYNVKGFFTSHKFTDAQTMPMRLALMTRHNEIAEFVSKIRNEMPCSCASRDDTVFWNRVDSYLSSDPDSIRIEWW